MICPLPGVPQRGDRPAFVGQLEHDAAVERAERVGLARLDDDRQAHRDADAGLAAVSSINTRPSFLAPSLSRRRRSHADLAIEPTRLRSR